MATIPTLQIPSYAPEQAMEWTTLSKLGDAYRDGRQRRTLADLANTAGVDGKLDYNKASLQLLASGDKAGAMSLAQLGMNQAQQEYGRSRDTANDQWKREEAARAQGNWEREYGLKQQKLGMESRGQGGIFGTPIYGRDPQTGETVVGALAKDGSFRRVDTNGVAITPGVSWQDMGTYRQGFNTKTGEPVTDRKAKDLVGVESQKILGKESGQAIVALPQALATGNETLQAIENVRNHKGRSWGTGVFGTIPGIPGTDQRGFVVALDQLKGKTFLQAFNALRGAGAITEEEGAKATNAMARLDRAQNKDDFEAGLNDLRDVIKSGMFRAQAKARMGSAPAPQPQGGQGGITQEQFNALPSGSVFTAPDGSQRVKP